MPRNDLADTVMRVRQEDKKKVLNAVRSWADSSTIDRHRQQLQAEADVVDDLNRAGENEAESQLDRLIKNAESAWKLAVDAVHAIRANSEIVLDRAFWEPSTGTVDNIGLLQIKDFFTDELSSSADDLNDFTLFDVPDNDKKEDNLASLDKVINRLQHLLGRPIDMNESRDPLVSALHEYLVDPDYLQEQATSSQSRLFFPLFCMA